jgi:glycosyltransferase involved in cell wall biosynthesis
MPLGIAVCDGCPDNLMSDIQENFAAVIEVLKKHALQSRIRRLSRAVNGESVGPHTRDSISRARISIAMATYNGERFLQEQLESLVNQEHLPYELVVCDDGSNDRTVAILNNFASKAPFLVKVYKNEHRLGFPDNFFKAARLCRGNLIAFSDQDDVWMPEKLKVQSRAFSNPKILLAAHSWIVTDEQLNPIHVKRWKTSIRKFVGPWFYINGFSLICRRSFLEEFQWAWPQRPEDANKISGSPRGMAHDHWLCTLAQYIGEVALLEEPLALHRRHATNVTGEHHKGLGMLFRNIIAAGQRKYAFLGELALEYADYFEEVRNRSKVDYRDTLSRAAARYRKVSEVNLRRALIYDEANTLAHRISGFLMIALRGQYHRRLGLGYESFFKDLAVVTLSLVGLRLHDLKCVP